MNTRSHNYPLLAFALFCFFLLLPGAAAAEEAEQDQEQEDDMAPSAVEREWNFGAYGFAVTLPQAKTGWYYPMPGMVHGAVFPLGPLGKPEENRELLVWAHYDMGIIEGHPTTLKALLLADLESSQADVPGFAAARFFEPNKPGTAVSAQLLQRRQAGVTFLGYRAEQGNQRVLTLMGRCTHRDAGGNPGTFIHIFRLSSTAECLEQDEAYLWQVFETFRLIEWQ